MENCVESQHVDNPPPPAREDEMPTINSNESINLSAQAVQILSNKSVQLSPQPTPKAIKRFLMVPSMDGLPDDLIKLFKPLYCDLCMVKLNSAATARLHYDSKNHEKKINVWLNEWSQRTGEPIPKRQTAMNKGPTGPNALYCDVCDLALTSLQHANQHNMGRKHQNALVGKGKPRKSGYFDSNNKWIRTSTIIDDDSKNKFSFENGLLIKLNNNEMTTNEECEGKSVPSIPQLALNISDIHSIDNINEVDNLRITPIAFNSDVGKYCKICDINVTSDMHMQLHLCGAKHAKKLRQLGEPPYVQTPFTLAECNLTEVPNKRYKNHIVADSGINAQDFSVFRTPSGQYYCQICDLSVTSEITLSQHFASKRHLKTSKRK